MTIAISLKIQEQIFKDLEKMRLIADLPRNTYINQAIASYNQRNRKSWLKKQIKKASRLTKESSLEVLHEFEALQDPIFE